MSNRSCTRRRALQLGGAGLIGGLAGCGGTGNGDGTTSGNGSGNGNGGDGSSVTALDTVPSGAAMVAHVEVGTLLDGPVAKQGIEETLALVQEQQPSYSGPTSYDEVLSMAEGGLGVDPEGLTSMTAFLEPQDGPGEPPFGLVLDAEWSESDVVTALESKGGASLSAGSYNGATTYQFSEGEMLLAVLSDGRFVLGLERAVKGVVDVRAGDADPVGGRVATAYENAPAGPIRMGMDVAALRQSNTMAGPMASVETVSGGLAVDGDTRRMIVDLTATDESAASSLAGTIKMGLSQMREETQSGDMPQRIQDAFLQLSEIEVTQEGTTVTIEHTTSAEEAGVVGTMLMAVVGAFFINLGQRTEPVTPVASFSWDYEADPGTLTITHDGGDTLQGSNVYVRGSTGSGSIDRSWAEYGVSEVKAGSSITIENVTGEFDLMIVWESPGGGASSALSSYKGPDA